MAAMSDQEAIQAPHKDFEIGCLWCHWSGHITGSAVAAFTPNPWL
jgi:hypothetical protein